MHLSPFGSVSLLPHSRTPDPAHCLPLFLPLLALPGSDLRSAHNFPVPSAWQLRLPHRLLPGCLRVPPDPVLPNRSRPVLFLPFPAESLPSSYRHRLPAPAAASGQVRYSCRSGPRSASFHLPPAVFPLTPYRTAPGNSPAEAELLPMYCGVS